ncbi:MAG: hypothetical protein NWE76_01370 [Candidatus Bathyarchaeota archaeon]|nr:hypothetical protein [Candidatus Bathyarchaeota archaeon]
MAKLQANVLGIDSAAVNSGLCIMQVASPNKGAGLTFSPSFESGIVHGPLNDHAARIKAAALIKGLCVQYEVDFVVVEGYALRVGPNNTSMAQHGETVGLIKKALHDLRMPFMVCPPTSMRSFLSVPRGLKDGGKQLIIEKMEEQYGFKSEMSNQSKRSNATDAAVHAVIGGLIYMSWHGRDIGELEEAKTKVLFTGDGKKMKGLRNMPELYHGCDWAVFDE